MDNAYLKNSLITILSLMRHKAADKNLTPVISVNKLIQMMKVTGLTLTYSQLSSLTQEADIAPLIGSLNKDKLTLNMDIPEEESDMETEEPEFSPDDFPDEPMDNEVSPDMASSAQQATPEQNQFQDENTDINLPRENVITKMAKRAASR